MGIDYSAMLFYGMELPKSFNELLEEYDGDWKSWLAEKLDVEYWSAEYIKTIDELGITILHTSLLGDNPIYYLAVQKTDQYANYTPVKFSMPKMSKKEMKDKLKEACVKLGLEYEKPKWILVINVS